MHVENKPQPDNGECVALANEANAGSNNVLEAPDPFSPARLRLTPDLATGMGVKKAILKVPVRKPDKTWFVRAHPAPEYRLETMVCEMEGNEIYLLDPELWSLLSDESTVGPRLLVTAINRQNTLFLWPIKLPGPNGKNNNWNTTLKEAAELAQKGWVRVQANMNAGQYDVGMAPPGLPEPAWPSMPFQDLLKLAFKDHLIDDLDHPVLRRLRGEI
jgi:hypothetical protein